MRTKERSGRFLRGLQTEDYELTEADKRTEILRHIKVQYAIQTKPELNPTLIDVSITDIIDDRIDFRLEFENTDYISLDQEHLDSISIQTDGYIFIDPVLEINFQISESIEVELPRLVDSDGTAAFIEFND